MNPEGAEVQSAKTIEFLAWLEVNKRRLLAGAVVIGLVAAGAAIYRWHQGERSLAADTALLKLQLTEASGASQMPRASDYQKVAADHAGTSAAARALLFAGEALYRDGHYAEALAEFEKAVGLLPDASLQAVAAYGRAASLDALGKLEEAQTAYQEIAAQYAATSVADQAKLVLGGLLERKGDVRQALQTYNQLTNTTVSGWASEAQMRRAALLASRPDLGLSNAPAPAVPTGS